jgi:predicted MFS family arabinose efflux permease
MCFSTFLSEGAMLDWSAVFLRDLKDITPEFAGAGYAAFSIAMAVMRLLGDRIVSKLNSKTVVGGIIAVTGVILIRITYR